MKKRFRSLMELLLIAIVIVSVTEVTRLITIKQMENHYNELPYRWEQVDFNKAPYLLMWSTIGTNETYSWWSYSNDSFIFEVEEGYFLDIWITVFVVNYFVGYEGRISKSLKFSFEEPVSVFYVFNVTFWQVIK